jgi:HK97 family phage prohead protease
MKYLSSDQFKKQKSNNAKLAKQYLSDVSETGVPRQLTFTLSTEDVDRDQDVVKQTGWDLDNYKMNPLVMWQHDTDSFPIGKCVDIAVIDGKLKGTVEFIDQSVPCAGEKSECIYQLCKTGFLSAVSVGFQAREWEFSDDLENRPNGIDILKADLYEFSIVNVPANPYALIEEQTETANLTNQTPDDMPKSADIEQIKATDAFTKEQFARRLRVIALNNRDRTYCFSHTRRDM